MRKLFTSNAPFRWQGATALIYAAFVFVVPAFKGASASTWLLTVLSFVAFVVLYADFFAHWSGPKARQVADIAGIAALGFVLLPVNTGGTTYIVYVAALTPFALRPGQSLAVFVATAGALWAVMTTRPDPDRFIIAGWVSAVIFIVGVGNMFLGDRIRQGMLLRRAREEIEELAKVAERERIARDLHDLLGHTLSVIALKSELASKLADRDPARAIGEIREVERVSREALAEVRAAVEGYKGRGFSGELHSAQHTLGSAGVRLDTNVEQLSLSPRQETVLALALRETVTNVVRHACASVCSVALAVDRGDLVLTIKDDGVGGPLREGNGLTGMRERVRAAGGTLDVDGSHGVRVCVRLPIAVATV